MRFRKKQVEIEAVQFNGCNRDEIENFMGEETNLRYELESETAYVAGKGAPIFSLIIPTLEGEMKAMPNDWIIRGVAGEYYPCKPNIFERTYEKI